MPPGGDVRSDALDHGFSRGAAPVRGDSAEGGAREAPDHVPAADWQRVIDAHGDRCWVVGCEERGALQFAHRWHRRFGGPNRWWNLMRLCLAHHRAFDSEQLRIRPNEGEFLIVDRRDRIVGRLLPLPGAGPPPDP